MIASSTLAINDESIPDSVNWAFVRWSNKSFKDMNLKSESGLDILSSRLLIWVVGADMAAVWTERAFVF